MNLKQMAQTELLQGVLVKIIHNPAILYYCKDAGADFVFFDCEHGVLSYQELHDLMLLGNELQLPSIVRVAQCQRGDISKILDFGATGVMAPMIETRQQAMQLVEWSKYPPMGKRSYAGGAHTKYGPSGSHEAHMTRANDNVKIAQIETVKGVNNVTDIASVAGIDALLIGPCDLAISNGHSDDIFHPQQAIMIQHVIDVCHTYQKAFGIIGNNDLLQRYVNDCNFAISAIDTNILRDGIKQAIFTGVKR